MHGRRWTLLASALGSALAAIPAGLALADSTKTFDGTEVPGGLDHDFIEFDVPAGTKEIQIDHTSTDDADILDWGLNDPKGFRGWGGGNKEPAVVGELASSRSYLIGPIAAGTWKVVIGKAKIVDAGAPYHVVVTLRDAPTLPAQTERKPYLASAPLSKQKRWYAGDLHAHTRESGDAKPEIEDFVTFARSQGLDFIETSDHNTVSQLDFIDGIQAKHSDILVLPGEEFTTYQGHANGIGATSWVDHKIGQPGVTIDSAVDAFHAEGALFSINHPLYDLGNLCIGCSWKYDELSADKVDAVEIATAGTGDLFGEGTLAIWDKLLDSAGPGHHIAALAGSDDHTAGVETSNFSTPIGVPTLYVYADGLSVSSIMAGIKAGRTVVKFHGVTDPMVDLESDVALDGDTVHAEKTTLHALITGAKGEQVRYVINGTAGDPVDVTDDPFDFALPVTAPKSGQDRYRVEVLSSGLPTTVTSHVWVEYKAGVGVTPTPTDDSGCQAAPGSTESGFSAELAFVAFGTILARRRATSKRGKS